MHATLGAAWFAVFAAGCCLCHTDSQPSAQPYMASSNAAPVPSPWKAGAATVEIAVPSGAPLAGYGGSPRRELNFWTLPLNIAALAGSCPNPTVATFFAPSKGKKDAVYARALVLANDTRKIAIVKIDAIGMSRSMRDDIAAGAIAANLGIAPPDLVVLATHTHSGPGGLSKQILWQLAASDCYSDATYQAVLSAASNALSQANAALQPAQVGVGSTTVTGASENRDGQPTVIDRTLGLIKITAANGTTPIAALFNFAVHGTVYDPTNMDVSADCMGPMETAVQTGLPGGVAIFTNSAEGDIAPASGQTAAQIGTTVGLAVVTLWGTITTSSQGALSTVLIDVKMPDPSFNGCLPLSGTSTTLCSALPGFPAALPIDAKWLSTTLPFQAVAIDSTVLVGIPGEPLTDIGTLIKSHGPTKGFAHTYILALANDHGAYFTTTSQYTSGSYEARSTLYGSTTGDVVVTNGKDVIDLLP